MAVLAFVFMLAVALSRPAWVYGREPSLRKTALEQRLDSIRDLAFGASKVKVPAMPVNEEALLNYLAAFRQEKEKTGSSFSWEDTARYNWARFAVARNQLGNEVPPRDGLETAIQFYDLVLSFQELRIAQLRYHLDTLSSYTAFYRRSDMSMTEHEEARLMEHLDQLQSRLENRIAASKTMFWEQESKRHDSRERERAGREARRVRQLLPGPARRADTKSLKEFSTQWENEVFTGIIPEARIDYPSFLRREIESLQKQLPALRKLSWTDPRWRTWEAKLFYACDELCSWTERTAVYQCNVLWLHASRGMFQRSYGESKGRMPDRLELPNWRKQEVFFGDAARKEIQQLRKFVNAVEKVYSESSIWIDVEDWWVKHGKDISPRLFDAIIHDATSWLEDFPATREVVHEEISRLAGVPNYKDRFDRLTEEEQESGQRAVRRTLKDVMKDFDTSAVQHVRDDLDIFEYMLGTYPPETLAAVKVDTQGRSGKERLKHWHGRHLDSQQAAEAYTDLHVQMIEDMRTVSQEFRKMMLGFSVNTTFHARAAAKE